MMKACPSPPTPLNQVSPVALYDTVSPVQVQGLGTRRRSFDGSQGSPVAADVAAAARRALPSFTRDSRRKSVDPQPAPQQN
eukprot:3706287-Prymnesium_polylepis.1